MKSRFVPALVLLTLLAAVPAAFGASRPPASQARQFLEYVYGGDDLDLEKLCWPHDDLWLVRGARNEPGLEQLAGMSIPHGPNEVLWENVQNALCIVEVREGRIDASFMIEQIFALHRELVLRFLHASLQQDREFLEQICTHAGNVRFGRFKPVSIGNLAPYEELLIRIPVVRQRRPAEDKSSRSVLYRVPLGTSGFVLRLVKQGSQWRIDTGTPVDVPLEFFFR